MMEMMVPMDKVEDDDDDAFFLVVIRVGCVSLSAWKKNNT